MKIAYNPIGGAVLTVSPPENDITFDLPGQAIWAKGVRFGKYETFLKHTSASGGGRDGLVPAPNYTATAVRFLREDGTWIVPTNTTYNVVSNTTDGLAPKVINTNTSTITNTYYILASSNGSATPSWYKLPTSAFANDDTKVTQTNTTTTTSTYYRVLFSGNANDNTETTTARKSTTLQFDPCTGNLKANSLSLNGDIVINDGTNKDRFIKFQYANGDNYGWRIGYLGDNTTNGNLNNALSFESYQNTKGWAKVLYFDHATMNATFGASVTASTFIGNIDGQYVDKLTGYTKANAVSSIKATDSLNTALGKLEYKADSAYELVKGAYDGDGTIENLTEILKVLEGIKDTETIQSIIGKYLPLTGGTMSGNVTWEDGTGHDTILPGHVYRNFHSKTEATETTKAKGEIYDHYYPRNPQATSYANLRVWDADNSTYKTLRFGGDGTFTWNSQTILHSGNSHIRNNTITINGISLSPLVVSGTATQIIKGNGSYEEDSLYFKYRGSIQPDVNADNLAENGLYLNITGTNKDETKPNVNFPARYGYLINFYSKSGGWSGCQLHIGDRSGNYQYRTKFDNSWGEWKILLDSNNYSNYLPFLNSTSTHATKASKIYAPTSGGTAGQILKSNGNAAPTWVNSTTLTAGSITHTSIGTNDTNKYYLLGSSSQNSSVTVNSNSNVYIQSGELHANNVWGIHTKTSNLQLDTTWNHSKIAFGPTASTTTDYTVEVLDGEGSYVVQLSNGTGIWTGYFSIRHTSNPGTTTTIADEIVLQGGDSNTYERPYLRTLNMGNNVISLQIAYSTTLNDSSDWVFSFKRLI